MIKDLPNLLFVGLIAHRSPPISDFRIDCSSPRNFCFLVSENDWPISHAAILRRKSFRITHLCLSAEPSSRINRAKWRRSLLNPTDLRTFRSFLSPASWFELNEPAVIDKTKKNTVQSGQSIETYANGAVCFLTAVAVACFDRVSTKVAEMDLFQDKSIKITFRLHVTSGGFWHVSQSFPPSD